MLREFRSRRIGLDGYQSSVLSPHIDGYLKWMTERGYSRVTLHGYLGHIRAFSAFQKKRRIELKAISDNHIQDFVRWYQKSYKGPFARRAENSPGMGKHQAAAMKSFIGYLQEQGIASKPNVDEAIPRIIVQYLEYLRVHRGLSEVTIGRRRKCAVKFHQFLENRSLDFGSMHPKDIEDFVMAAENPRAPTARSSQVEFMRGFFRYLRANRLVPETCEPFLPSRRRYRDAALPTVLQPGDVRKTLQKLNRSVPTGRRDYAILQMLKTYGLRGGEVAALSLSDIDWRAEVIRVRQTKTRRTLELPLLPPVARSIIAYLKAGRPKASTNRALFLNTVAPYRGMTTGGIWQVVAKALHQAGVKSHKRGSHIFRHTKATDLLRVGAPLKSISDVLGHKNPNSTFWYCKVAVADLRQVALELPGGAQ